MLIGFFVALKMSLFFPLIIKWTPFGVVQILHVEIQSPDLVGNGGRENNQKESSRSAQGVSKHATALRSARLLTGKTDTNSSANQVK